MEVFVMKSIGRKRIGLVALVLVFSLLVCCAAAEGTSIVASGTCGTNLTWELDRAGTLTISGSGEMTDWYSNSSVPWYSYRSSIRSVEIGSGVMRIGYDAFRGCSSLESIVIPEGVTSIGSSAFEDCSSLESITLPDSVTSIGFFAFRDCSSLREVYIPTLEDWLEIRFKSYDANPMYYAKELYIGGKLLTHAVIPEGVTSIGNSAFSGYSNLKSIMFPESVTSIGSGAFWCCSSLESITLPAGVMSFGAETFGGCSNLTSVTFCGDIPDIGTYSFLGCDRLQKVTVLGDSVAENTGDLFDNLKPTIYCYKYTDVDSWAREQGYNIVYLDGENVPESISIPESMELSVGASSEINVQAFPDYPNLTYTWSSSAPEIAKVKDGVVTACYPGTAIITAALPNGLSASCTVSVTARNTMTLPDSLTGIEAEAFENTNAEAVILPDGCTTIGSRAFAGAADLVVFMPDSVTDIADDAFSGCAKLCLICESDNAAAAYAEANGISYRIENPE